MNKLLTLLLVSLSFYWIIKAILNLFVKKKIKRREYQLTVARQADHLFYALLLTFFPVSVLINYYQLMPEPIKIAMMVAGSLCLLCALISFYLYFNYLIKTPYQSLIYDPYQLTLELVDKDDTLLITARNISKIKWYRVKNSLRNLAWGSFQYLELELRNGSKLVIPSLIIKPEEMATLLRTFEVVHIKKIIPRM